MAIVKCSESCRGNNTKHTYSSTPYAPQGYPKSGLICGATDCENDGLVWLTMEEEKDYKQNRTDIFSVGNKTNKGVKVKVAEPLPRVR